MLIKKINNDAWEKKEKRVDLYLKWSELPSLTEGKITGLF